MLVPNLNWLAEFFFEWLCVPSELGIVYDPGAGLCRKDGFEPGLPLPISCLLLEPKEYLDESPSQPVAGRGLCEPGVWKAALKSCVWLLHRLLWPNFQLEPVLQLDVACGPSDSLHVPYSPGPGGDSLRPDTPVRAPNLKDGDVPFLLVACGPMEEGISYTGPGDDMPRVLSV